MGIGDGFKPERRASVGELADAVHASVTMEQAINLYCPSLVPRHKRIPCPIHCGRDYNVSYNDRFFYCFVCGAGGDVISFVKAVCELSTRLDAITRISADFGLGLDVGAPLSTETSAKVKAARERAEAERQKREAWERRYHAALDEWVRLDRIVRETEQDTDDGIETVCKARERLAMVSYELSEIESGEKVMQSG